MFAGALLYRAYLEGYLGGAGRLLNACTEVGPNYSYQAKGNLYKDPHHDLNQNIGARTINIQGPARIDLTVQGQRTT